MKSNFREYSFGNCGLPSNTFFGPPLACEYSGLSFRSRYYVRNPKRDSVCFPLRQRFRKFRSEFKWNQRSLVHFGFFWPEYSGSPLEVVHLFPEIHRSIFDKPVLCPKKGIRKKESKKPFLLVGPISFHFPQVFPLISDRSVWHNGKHALSSCFARSSG